VELGVPLLGFTARRLLLRPTLRAPGQFWPNICTGRFGQRIFDDPMDVVVDLIEFVGNVSFLIKNT
jgi:hypothetical protein